MTTVSQVLPFHFTTPFSGCLRSVSRTWPKIYEGAFFAKILNGFKLLTIFAKKSPLQMFDWVENRILAKGLKYWVELTLVHSLQIKAKKYSARKNVWRYFWKGERSWCDSKQKECLCRSHSPNSSLKSMLWEFSQNSQGNICAGISFLVFSCEFCGISRNTFFAEQHLTTAFDYSSIRSSEGSTVLVNETVNYDTKPRHVY